MESVQQEVGEFVKSTRWCWTINNPWKIPLNLLEDTPGNAATRAMFSAKCDALLDSVTSHCNHVYTVFQLEVGEQGTPHLQGYSQFRNVLERGRQETREDDGKMKKGRGFMKYFPLEVGYPHCTRAYKAATANRSYCTKEEGRIMGPWEKGECPGAQTGRDEKGNPLKVDDSLEFARLVKDNGWWHWGQIPLEWKCSRNAHNYRTVMSELQLERLSTQMRDVRVAVLVGEAGWGKTRMAWQIVAEQGWKPQTRQIGTGAGKTMWFSNVEMVNDVLILDEFDAGQMTLTDFNQLLDGYPCLIPSKGKSGYASFTKVIIMSNFAPEQWFKREVMTYDDQLGRRVHDDAGQAEYDRRRNAMLRRVGRYRVNSTFNEQRGKTWDLASIDDHIKFGAVDAQGRADLQTSRFYIRREVTEWLRGDITRMVVDPGVDLQAVNNADTPQDEQDAPAVDIEEPSQPSTPFMIVEDEPSPGFGFQFDGPLNTSFI